MLCHKLLAWQQFIHLPKNNMRKIVFLILFVCVTKTAAQNQNRLFGKDPIINLENFQKKRVHFGFFLGFNSFDFKIDYKKANEDIQVKKTTGFNVGIVTDLRLHEHVNLRFEPGLYYSKRDLQFSENLFADFTPKTSDLFRVVNSTYIHFPLLFKFSSLRTGNIKPFLLGGASATLNLSSSQKSLSDNYQNRFRVKSWTHNYELGFGIDIFSEYFIFSPSIRGVFGLNDELVRDSAVPSGQSSPWTGNIESIKNRAILINFTFH